MIKGLSYFAGHIARTHAMMFQWSVLMAEYCHQKVAAIPSAEIARAFMSCTSHYIHLSVGIQQESDHSNDGLRTPP